jgi:hypothetical protein
VSIVERTTRYAKRRLSVADNPGLTAVSLRNAKQFSDSKDLDAGEKRVRGLKDEAAPRESKGRGSISANVPHKTGK